MHGQVAMGVIGVGTHGSRHARVFAESTRVELVGIYDIDPDVAARVAGRHGTRAFDTRESLLDATEAISIAVPTASHHEVAMAALTAGHHVLVEKPMARTLEEADALVDAARHAGSVLHLGHVERFNPAVLGARPYVDDIRLIEAHRLAPFQTRGTDVAVILDLLIHDLDLVLDVTGEWPSDIRAVGVPVMTEHIDIVNVRLEFPSGAVANLTASRVARQRMRRMRLFQPTGYFSLDLGAGTGTFTRLRDGWAADQRVDAPDHVLERVALGGVRFEPLVAELEAFACAAGGGGDGGVSGEEGRAALALALEIADVVAASKPLDLSV